MDPVLPGQTSLGGYALGPSFGTLIGIGLWRVIIPVLAVVLTISSAAYAHRPIIAGSRAPDPESAPRISDPSVSRVLYFELTDQSPVQWFVIENDRPWEIPVLLGVPVGKDVGVSNPVLTLFGEGLGRRSRHSSDDRTTAGGEHGLAHALSDWGSKRFLRTHHGDGVADPRRHAASSSRDRHVFWRRHRRRRRWGQGVGRHRPTGRVYMAGCRAPTGLDP